MYKVLLDDTVLCSSRLEKTSLISPKVTMEANKAGKLEFTIPPDHPRYDDISLRTSVIDVMVDTEEVFRGFPTDIVTDFYKQKTVTCEGMMSALNDSIVRPVVYTNQSVSAFLTAVLASHNSQVVLDKQIYLGTVTVTGSISMAISYKSTMEVLQEVVKEHGGYIRVEWRNSLLYLDYLASSPNNNKQIVHIGKNLIDLSQTMTAADVATRCVPLGAKLGTYTVPEIEDRLDIKSVNGGLDYLDSVSAQAEYGIVTKVVDFEDIGVASDLKTAGQTWLSSEQYAGLVIDATAFDLNLTDTAFERFKLLDTVTVISQPHGLNRTFVISKMELNLDDPAANRIQLGKEVTASLTARTADTQADVREIADTSVNPSAVKGIIENAHGGTIYTHYNADGVADELYILDGATLATSTRWWRFNINGWAYTGDGGATYSVAADMTGTLTANVVEAVIGHIAGWTLASTEIYKTGNFDVTGWDAQLLAIITMCLLGSITQEQAIAAGADVDGSGYVDSMDLAIVMGAILGYFSETSGTYKASVSVDTPFSAFKVKANNSVVFEAGVHGCYADNVYAKNNIQGGMDPSSSDTSYLLKTDGTLQLHRKNGSNDYKVRMDPMQGASYTENGTTVTKAWSALIGGMVDGGTTTFTASTSLSLAGTITLPAGTKLLTVSAVYYNSEPQEIVLTAAQGQCNIANATKPGMTTGALTVTTVTSATTVYVYTRYRAANSNGYNYSYKIL